MEKGQSVLVLTTGNAARDGSKVYKATVVGIGRKYFTVHSYDCYGLERHKFRLEDLVEESNYSPDYKVYLSQEDLDEVYEKPVLRKEIDKLLSEKTYKELLKIRELL